MTHAVLTGRVHIGKTTVCRAVAQLAQERGYCVRGILTPPILNKNGRRLGIEVVDLSSGERRELARTDRDAGGPHVGPYQFDSTALQWAQDTLARAIAVGCDLLIVDEIGRLELERNEGFHQILDLLGTSVVLRSLLVVRASLLKAFRRRLPQLEFITFRVTDHNRDTLPFEIAERFYLA